MNRRVLLIDVDPAFRDTLTRELARYRVEVTTEPDAERALALAHADAPALILLCIEEADKKAGFRVFEKCKKGTASKVPIILVTGSVPAESFAKHRNLKAHADEYIDKRTMSTHELVGKIDGLIALGDPDDEELAIPVEDEIPMEIADGDVVLDEVVGDDMGEQPALLSHEPPVLEDPEPHDDFEHEEARTVGGDGLTVDSVVEAETDAAFEALLGGSFGDEPEPQPEPGPEAIDEANQSPEPSLAMAPAEPELSPVDVAVEPEPEQAVSIPELIHDGRGRGTTPPPLVDSVPAIILDSPLRDADDDYQEATYVAPEAMADADADAVPELVPHQEPGLPPQPLEPDHERHDEPEPEPIVAEALPESIDVAALADAADAPPDGAPHRHETDVYVPHEDVDEDVAEDVAEDVQGSSQFESSAAIDIDDDELVPLDDDELPLEVEVEEPDQPAEPADAMLVGPDAARDAEPAAEPLVTQVPRPPILPETPPAELRTPPRGGSGSHPAIDLGLDVVAEDARSEQSGVYDRRALRKIGELERQIAQLKVELERSRAAQDTAARGGRESQFLHLRESMLAKDKELKQIKADLVARDGELAEASERLRQAQQARGSLEAKQGELEQRAADEAGRAQQLAAAIKTSESHASGLQQELERATRAAAAAEAARAQLEHDPRTSARPARPRRRRPSACCEPSASSSCSATSKSWPPRTPRRRPTCTVRWRGCARSSRPATARHSISRSMRCAVPTRRSATPPWPISPGSTPTRPSRSRPITPVSRPGSSTSSGTRSRSSRPRSPPPRPPTMTPSPA